ncbi:type VI secretion system baseplate subunit TssE [Sulfidibacter corallicola]|uniref:Type VI secretion system baseplate subunit TssE n=1 Tax=Sulfidibacter corallicola TaxID=2818388 RepID=A0A8A4TTS9_SULCO|nr:type VI secretion system baseplate subunit TssE [Sulfidibacter corallicola]QTD53376.1 type VI secretion system baseplate subunit TssE [Sulfidibacter corallicola]
MGDQNFMDVITGGERYHRDLAESIQEHLALLLNNRKGMTAHLPDFGLPDIHYVYYSLPQSLENLGSEIKRTIEKFEPRLKRVEVRLQDTSHETFRATYRVTGEIKENGRVSKLTFHTDVLRDGSAETAVVNPYDYHR